MIDIRNKEMRRELIRRYMDAETSPNEEKLLANYYTCHEPDNDEQAIAQLIRMENINDSLLSDEGVDEFDRIINGAKQKNKQNRMYWIAWASGIVAIIALLFMSVPSTSQLNTTEIAQSIHEMMNLPMNDIVSITATPIDEHVWIKTTLKDGTTQTFIMEKDKEKGTTTLLAIIN